MHQCDIDSNAWFHRVLFEVDLWQEPNGKAKKGTSIGQRLDVFTGLRGCPLYIVRIYAHHLKWYITRDLSAVSVLSCVWELFWICCGHWIISWHSSTFCEICFVFSVFCNDFWSFCLTPKRLPKEMWRWRGIFELSKTVRLFYACIKHICISCMYLLKLFMTNMFIVQQP